MSRRWVILFLIAALAGSCSPHWAPQRASEGQAILYKLDVSQHVFRPVDDPEGNRTWLEADPLKAAEPCIGTEDICGCAGFHEAETALIFIPEGSLKVEWHAVRGDAGRYKYGAIVQTGEEWSYAGPVYGEQGGCDVTEAVTDAVGRLTRFSVACRWRADGSGCRGEDAITVRFPEEREIFAPTKELPWNTEVEGETFRYGDDSRKLPATPPKLPDDETTMPEVQQPPMP